MCGSDECEDINGELVLCDEPFEELPAGEQSDDISACVRKSDGSARL